MNSVTILKSYIESSVSPGYQSPKDVKLSSTHREERSPAVPLAAWGVLPLEADKALGAMNRVLPFGKYVLYAKSMYYMKRVCTPMQ